MALKVGTLRIAFFAVAFGSLAGIAAALLWRQHTAPLQLAAGSYLRPSRALPDFSLIDHHGRAFGPADLKGHWSLMLFGYTNCPDFCPTTLTTLAELEKRLRSGPAAVRPQVLFMSVDAGRDTPDQLAQYVPYFDPAFLGLTAANQPAIEAVAAKLGVAVILTPHADGSYSVDHSSMILVFNPKGKVAAILTGPFTVNALQQDFQHIVAEPL
jgi:protein SCO1/2